MKVREANETMEATWCDHCKVWSISPCSLHAYLTEEEFSSAQIDEEMRRLEKLEHLIVQSELSSEDLIVLKNIQSTLNGNIDRQSNDNNHGPSVPAGTLVSRFEEAMDRGEFDPKSTHYRDPHTGLIKEVYPKHFTRGPRLKDKILGTWKEYDERTNEWIAAGRDYLTTIVTPPSKKKELMPAPKSEMKYQIILKESGELLCENEVYEGIVGDLEYLLTENPDDMQEFSLIGTVDGDKELVTLDMTGFDLMRFLKEGDPLLAENYHNYDVAYMTDEGVSYD